MMLAKVKHGSSQLLTQTNRPANCSLFYFVNQTYSSVYHECLCLVNVCSSFACFQPFVFFIETQKTSVLRVTDKPNLSCLWIHSPQDEKLISVWAFACCFWKYITDAHLWKKKNRIALSHLICSKST